MCFLMGSHTLLGNIVVLLVSLQYTIALRCLRCNGVTQPQLCSGIEHCPDGEICVTESYRTDEGKTLFNVGCMSTQRCSLTPHGNSSANFQDTNGTHVQHVCTECCHGDLCNAARCGADGYPQERGPVCLTCAQTRDPAECDVISVCAQGEVCHIEEIYQFGDTFYKTSCVQNTDRECAPPPVYNPVEIGRRATRRGNCFLCCPDDLCNTKCNATPSLVPSTTQPTSLSPTSHHGSKGTEFFLMFMRNLNYDYSRITLSTTVTFSAPEAQIQVITSLNSTSKLVSGPANRFDIDANFTMRHTGKTNKGIIVTSNIPISVTASNFFNCCVAEDYLALPIESLGVSYIVGTFRSTSTFGGQFAVGAPYDNTVVNITLSSPEVYVPSKYHREGDTITVVLDKLDTFLLDPDYYTLKDLTGTRIVSDKPIAVVSGHRCSAGHDYCNHLVEYLPPVSKWGSKFLVPPLRSARASYIRIVTSENNTNINVTAKLYTKHYSISNFTDIVTLPYKPYVVSSDKPILVLLFPIRESIGMTIVPSIDQFSHGPVLIAPPVRASDFENFIVVTIRHNDQSELMLQSVSGTDLPIVGYQKFTDVDGEEYSFISVTCNDNQTCSISDTDNNVTFSVIAYGFRKPFKHIKSIETYAYPGNLGVF
ncbi:IgGFc-binding protein-like [Pecten maximus]|uniref:IgGFc-binding protein-like n=1 Tax=Pecten maximus TaxID=6579 RepID=UPI0014583BFC|nr:IgGFc-binding protein-like [Pecten maximus]